MAIATGLGCDRPRLLDRLLDDAGCWLLLLEAQLVPITQVIRTSSTTCVQILAPYDVVRLSRPHPFVPPSSESGTPKLEVV